MELQELIERIERWKQRQGTGGSEQGRAGRIVDEQDSAGQGVETVESDVVPAVAQQEDADLFESSGNAEAEDQTAEIDVDPSEEIG